MITHGPALIIDDRPEDGEPIGKVLWDNNISCLFFHYDEEKLEKIREEGRKYTRIRIIFQDIQLIGGGGTPNTSDFDAAVTTIDTLLSDNNGPWLLITWSTWCDEQEADNEQNYPERLFDHLKKNLKETKRPFYMLPLNKESFTIDPHGPVKDLNDEEVHDLSELINASIPQTKYLDAMWDWEHAVHDSAASVICRMASLVHMKSPMEFDPAPESTLGDFPGAPAEEPIKLDGLFAWMMKALADAEAGSTDDHVQLAKGFKSVIHQLHWDALNISETIPNELFQEEIPEFPLEVEKFSEWKRRVNNALHFSFSPDSSNLAGCLYNYDQKLLYPKPRSLYSTYGDLYRNENLTSHFLDHVKGLNEIKDIFVDFKKKTHLTFVDITPTCDIANKKAKLRKFCIGIKIPLPAFAEKPDEKSREKIRNKIKKIFEKCDFFWATPFFSKETSVLDVIDVTFFIFDLRLICTFPDSENVISRLQPFGRMKDQLLTQLINSVGPHMTRPGIVSL